MADLKDVVRTILTDLIEARHQANKYSHAISKEYVDKGELVNYSTPAIDIGNVKLDLKFVMEEPGDDTVETAPTLNRSEIIKAIDTISLKALAHNSLFFKAASDNTSNRKALAVKLSGIIADNTNKKTMAIDNAKVLSEATAIIRPHLGKDANGKNVSIRVIRSVISKMSKDSKKALDKAISEVKVNPFIRPKMIVDINKLKELDSGMIANLSLDLDMDAMDWHEIDNE